MSNSFNWIKTFPNTWECNKAGAHLQVNFLDGLYWAVYNSDSFTLPYHTLEDAKTVLEYEFSANYLVS